MLHHRSRIRDAHGARTPIARPRTRTHREHERFRVRRRASRERAKIGSMRLVTLGVGAQNSPRYAPAGLLVSAGGVRVMIDGGPGADPPGRVDAWLVTDERAELISAVRRLAAAHELVPHAGTFRTADLSIE